MKVKDLKFKIENRCEDDILYIAHTELGRFTILDRITGYGYRDIETGYKDENDLFWLVSGNFDIREFPDLKLDDAIYEIKMNSNNCKGV